MINISFRFNFQFSFCKSSEYVAIIVTGFTFLVIKFKVDKTIYAFEIYENLEIFVC